MASSPTTPRYCKYFFSSRGCNQGSECKYLHQQTEEVRMELPCTALSVDIETTGCWPGVHKIVAIGVVLFQLLPTHQVVELERRLFQFKVNYPQDFDEITMRDFWHVQGRMELLETFQNGAKSEEEAIKDFYDFYTEVCYRYPKFYMVTDNPVMDLGFLNLSIATKLRKPPLTYRPILRTPSPDYVSPPSTSGVTAASLAKCLEKLSLSSPPAASATRSSSTLSETESDDDETTSTEDGASEDADDADEDVFGESGEEDCGTDDGSSSQQIQQHKPAPEEVKLPQPQQAAESGKRLGAFYDDYSAPHFAIDLNSFACGLIGLHLPPFRKAGGTRWASPADFLSYHKPFLICPYRKTHDPVDDASFNCWQFLQCVSILWMTEYAEIHRKDDHPAQQQQQQQHNPQQQQHGSTHHHNANKNAGKSTKPTSFCEAEFPTIASANAEKQAGTRARTSRRGRNSSVNSATPSPTMLKEKQGQGQSRPRNQSASSSPTVPYGHQQQAKGGGGPARAPKRVVRSYSDPPVVEPAHASTNTSRALSEACHERAAAQRTPATKVLC